MRESTHSTTIFICLISLHGLVIKADPSVVPHQTPDQTKGGGVGSVAFISANVPASF